VRRPSARKADEGLGLRHQPPWRERFTRAARRSEQQVAPERRQCVEVLPEHLASDRFDQDVRTAAVGESQHLHAPTRFVAADRRVDTQLQHELASFGSACGPDDRVRAQHLRDLDCQTNHTTGGPMH
jgi:hypothetical protein